LTQAMSEPQSIALLLLLFLFIKLSADLTHLTYINEINDD
jgi:hypothetical protein